jgi:hypothetical protein
MKRLSVALLCCVTIAAISAYAQAPDPGFEMARVVAFDRVAADAQHMENSDQYKISVRLGNTVYACRGSGPASTFIDWSAGKEFPASLDMNNKIMSVKSPNGQIVQLKITGKKAAK